MSETISKKGLFIIGALIISTIGFAGFAGITVGNYNNMEVSRDNWESAHESVFEDYEEAYQDYLDASNNLTATEEDLAIALADLLIAEQNLQNAETELQLIEDNTELSGTFYVLSQSNQDYNLSPVVGNINYTYADYFFYRLTLEHPEHGATTYGEVAQIIAGYCRPSSVGSLAQGIRDNVDHPLDDECVIDGLLTFCQDRGNYEHCIHYVPDGVDDFSKYPIETLCEGCGDCEDKSILFASLARSLGYDVRICIVPGHCFVAVKLDSVPTHGDGWHIARPDGDYYICETTSYGWLIGDLPTDYQSEMIYSYQVL